MSQKHTEHLFQVIDQNPINKTWDGSPITLNPNDNVNLPQSTNGSMVLAYQNMATVNNAGTLSVTSGGNLQFLPAPALANAPSILVNNWGGNNVSVTNVSVPGSKTPIWVSAVGPGLAKKPPVNLPTDGSMISLASAAQAQGNAIPRWMQLIMQASSGDYTLVVIVGGPADSSGNNAYVIGLNAASNTGPNTGVNPPPGFYATSTGNLYTFQFNWGSSAIFVANESPSTGADVSVGVRAL